MARIRILPDGVIDRIAAGEVVERPASVLKELVENSLDAGAGSVEVRLRGGGRERVEVIDDGCGMEREDALLALERHATSKLADIEDLATIATLGFRGEALSSIASVSRLILRTATGDGPGTEVEVHGGRVVDLREVGMPRGTTVRVERLFYNVPARRKFLRAESTELGHATRWVGRYAIAYPGLRLKLVHGERALLDTPPADDLHGRITQLHGREFAGRLVPFERRAGEARAWGFAGRPVDALSRRDAQHVFVNGRAVQDRVLSHAITAAYGNTVPHGRHPALFLQLELPAADVDVNVHPQKTEVRLRDARFVHRLVEAALGEALGHERTVPSLGQLRPASFGDRTEGMRRIVLGQLDRHDVRESEAPGGWRSGAAAPAAAAERSEGERRLTRPRCLGQYRDSYIVAEDVDGLVLVDQHAAHERVLFERYLEEAAARRVHVQRLLFPVAVELSPAERVTLESEAEELERLGFAIEPFGNDTIRLDGVPALASELDGPALLRELLGEAERARSAAADVAALRHRLVTTTACHAAITVNHPLTREAMTALLDDLAGTRNPTTCPHGRPILFRLPLDEIERAFRRR